MNLRRFRRSRPAHCLTAVLVVLTVTGVTSPRGISPPAAAETGSASCTEMDGDTRVTWSADYTIDPWAGGVIRVDALRQDRDGVETDAGSLTWQLRWDNVASQWAPATPPASVVPFQQLEGPLAAVDGWSSVFWSPRLVTPDGSCTIYLTPFLNISHPPSGPRIAVLGDDLVTQLNDSDYNEDGRLQGYLEGDFNARGFRAEVEGQGPIDPASPVPGRRWTDDGAANPLERADSYLVDELRGLLEHDVDGFVMALGVHDALWIAEGADEAERSARRDVVFDKLVGVATDLQRAPCVAVVTAPQNESSLDPDPGQYASAANDVNNFWRFVIGAGGATGNAVLVDFGSESLGQPWFTADGVHLNETGIAVYRDRLTRAAEQCADSVVLWGREGTLDDGVWAGRTTTASGHAVTTRTVPGWQFNPGKRPAFSEVTADGTVFMSNYSTAGNVFRTAGSGVTAATAFDPSTNAFQNIRVTTDRGVDHPVDRNGDPVAGLTGDVGVLQGGDAVAFLRWDPYAGQSIDGCRTGEPCNQPEVQGQLPMLGVITRAADGTWEVTEGPDGPDPDSLPDWRNAWSPREVYDATVAADPVNGAAMFDAVCPASSVDPNGNPVRNCGWIAEMTVLPQSGDVVLSHYGTESLGVYDVSEPDAAGRIEARLTAVYELPEVADGLGGTPRELQADPSSTLGDERFGMVMDFAPGFVELRYDATNPDPAARLVPVSAPVLSGELTNGTTGDPPLRSFVGYGHFHYDVHGNLWVPTSEGFNDGFGMKVYENGPSGRRITQPECLELVDGAPRPLEDYRVSAPGARTEWGKACQPDYNIRAQTLLGWTWGIAEDPTSGDIILSNYPHGTSIVIDPEDPTPGGTALDMTFRISGPVGLLAQGTSQQPIEGPCADDPDERCTTTAMSEGQQGQVDALGRMWMAASRWCRAPIDCNDPEMMQRSFDQWIYSVDLGRMLGREPQALTARPGQATVVQAEVHETLETTQAAGTVAIRDVDAVAGFSHCTPSSCTDDDPPALTSGGFALGDEIDGAAPAGTTVTYNITVPKAGEYELVYRAANRRAAIGLSGDAGIRLSVDGGAPVDRTISAASMTVTGSPITLELAPGPHTLELSAPGGAHGWQLDWMRFTRL